MFRISIEFFTKIILKNKHYNSFYSTIGTFIFKVWLVRIVKLVNIQPNCLGYRSFRGERYSNISMC